VPITRDEVAHLARLARLDLSEDELARMPGQLDGILAAVAQVSVVAGDDVPPTSHAIALVNVLREDVVRPCLSAAAALSGAPAIEDDRFRVPRILGEEP
jgi:aspartyl-tRNA(Asn)/glutamyl-tRNA(Gln) amidotransferase subunit C